MTLGDKIRIARENAGLTMETLGRMCGTTKQTIYKYETGRVTNIPLDRLEMIAKSVGVTAASLMGWEEKEPQPTEHLTGETDNPNIKKDTTLSGDVDAELKCIWNNIDDADREFLLANARMLMERRNKK